jgi:hypothetical protein
MTRLPSRSRLLADRGQDTNISQEAPALLLENTRSRTTSFGHAKSIFSHSSIRRYALLLSRRRIDEFQWPG